MRKRLKTYGIIFTTSSLHTTQSIGPAVKMNRNISDVFQSILKNAGFLVLYCCKALTDGADQYNHTTFLLFHRETLVEVSWCRSANSSKPTTFKSTAIEIRPKKQRSSKKADRSENGIYVNQYHVLRHISCPGKRTIFKTKMSKLTRSITCLLNTKETTISLI